jgi:hypothetical protein
LPVGVSRNSHSDHLSSHHSKIYGNTRPDPATKNKPKKKMGKKKSIHRFNAHPFAQGQINVPIPEQVDSKPKLTQKQRKENKQRKEKERQQREEVERRTLDMKLNAPLKLQKAALAVEEETRRAIETLMGNLSPTREKQKTQNLAAPTVHATSPTTRPAVARGLSEDCEFDIVAGLREELGEILRDFERQVQDQGQGPELERNCDHGHDHDQQPKEKGGEILPVDESTVFREDAGLGSAHRQGRHSDPRNSGGIGIGMEAGQEKDEEEVEEEQHLTQQVGTDKYRYCQSPLESEQQQQQKQGQQQQQQQGQSNSTHIRTEDSMPVDMARDRSLLLDTPPVLAPRRAHLPPPPHRNAALMMNIKQQQQQQQQKAHGCTVATAATPALNRGESSTCKAGVASRHHLHVPVRNNASASETTMRPVARACQKHRIISCVLCTRRQKQKQTADEREREQKQGPPDHSAERADGTDGADGSDGDSYSEDGFELDSDVAVAVTA